VRLDESSPNDRAERHLVTRSRTQRLTMGFTGPPMVRLGAAGGVPAVVRSRVALCAASEPEGIDVFGCDRSNRSGLGCFVPLAPQGGGVKRSTKPEAVVEVATDRHKRWIEITRVALTCQPADWKPANWLRVRAGRHRHQRQGIDEQEREARQQAAHPAAMCPGRTGEVKRLRQWPADRAIDDHSQTSSHPAANALQRVAEICLVENGKAAGRFGDRTQTVGGRADARWGAAGDGHKGRSPRASRLSN
jgi:hypothetical protein